MVFASSESLFKGSFYKKRYVLKHHHDKWIALFDYILRRKQKFLSDPGVKGQNGQNVA
jgi:hypothetical protein